MQKTGKPNDNHRNQAIKYSDRSWSDGSERLKYANEYAQSGLKGLFLANGAAIVSILTYLGNSNGADFNQRGVWGAFVWFSLGLSSVLLTNIFGYVSHALYMQAAIQYSRQADRAALDAPQDPNTRNYERQGSWAENAGILLTIASLVFFVVGAFVALDAIV